jgi:RNA polymerase sigma-70 factor (ECF subfamily)
LITFARRYVGDRETAEDVVQNVFIAIWRNRHSITIESDIKAYLFTATRNQAINVLKHLRTAQKAEEEIRLALRVSEEPIDRVEYEQTRLRIEKAVNSLPDQSKRVFLMSRLDGLTYMQIAEVLGISVKTVETLMGRALTHIRSTLTVVLAGMALVEIFRFFL